MLSFKNLKFCNIGRFVSEQSIDFSSLDRIVEVGANNVNTGGSSGAGKSTVFHAVDYLLGINEIPATALQSRLTKEHMYAQGEFDVNGTPLIIRRSKKDGLYIKFGDEEVSGNVKLAEERLEEIIGIPKKLFKKMVHKKQKEGGFFLNLTAKESYDFLMNSLGLEKMTSNAFKIDEAIKKYISEIEKISSNIEFLDKSIQEFKEVVDMNKEPVSSYKEDELTSLERKLDTTKEMRESLNKSMEDELALLIQPVKQEIVISENPEIKSLEEKLATTEQSKKEKINKYTIDSKNAQDLRLAIKKELSEIPFHKEQMDNLIADMKDKMAQRKHIEDQKCPTCSQTWVGESATEQVAKINSNIEKIKEMILEKKALVEKEPTLIKRENEIHETQVRIEKEHSLDDINSTIDKLKQTITEFKSEDKNKVSKIENEYLTKLNEHNKSVNSIKDSYSGKISDIDEVIKSLNYEIHNIKTGIDNYKKALFEYSEKKMKLEKTIKSKKAELKENIEIRESCRKNLSIAEEAKRALKTYTLQIFQDTLDYIGLYATEILSNIPNMTGTTVYFEGCKETKSGSIKDEVNAIVNMDGYNDVNIKTLSGGERTAIDLAVDLAVIDMIESKAGKGADFFILDEPFDGLEEINISQCLEILQQIDTNKKIIIVDHNPIAKEMISSRIMVERNGEESVVL